MSIRATFHYFQGMECDMYSFYRIPKLLFTSEYTYDFIKSEIVLWRFFRDSYIGGKDNAHPYGRHFIYLSGEKGLYDIHCQTGKDRRDALQGIFK